MGHPNKPSRYQNACSDAPSASLTQGPPFSNRNMLPTVRDFNQTSRCLGLCAAASAFTCQNVVVGHRTAANCCGHQCPWPGHRGRVDVCTPTGIRSVSKSAARYPPELCWTNAREVSEAPPGGAQQPRWRRPADKAGRIHRVSQKNGSFLSSEVGVFSLTDFGRLGRYNWFQTHGTCETLADLGGRVGRVKMFTRLFSKIGKIFLFMYTLSTKKWTTEHRFLLETLREEG